MTNDISIPQIIKVHLDQGIIQMNLFFFQFWGKQNTSKWGGEVKPYFTRLQIYI